MVRPNKAPPRKQQRGAIDFKKIKRKIGRKLPPPRNATNLEIKSKAIVLPEQSVASDRAGLAVSSKGLTLKELLQQSSHHNARFRKSSLIGIRDLLLKFPAELKMHKLSIIEKLRERVSDSDATIRETFYQLLRSVIFASPKEVANDSSISLMMAYIFNAMTNLGLDIRLMAFKFLDLVLTSYHPSAFLYAEKVLDHYKDMLQNRQIYLQDIGKIKAAFAGLVNFLNLLVSDGEKSDLQNNQEPPMQKPLHSIAFESQKEHKSISSICKKLEEIVPVLIYSFKLLAPTIGEMTAFDAQSYDCICKVLQCVKLVTGFLLRELKQSRSPAMLKQVCSIKIYTEMKRLWDLFPVTSNHQLTEKEEDRCHILNVRIAEIFLQFIDGIEKDDNQMIKFLNFIESSLFGLLYQTRQPDMGHEKYLVPLLSHFPMLISQVGGDWKNRLLQGFTRAFQECKIESKLNLACLSVIEQMLLHNQDMQQCDIFEPDILAYKSCWLEKLPRSLLQLKDANPSLSKVIIRLILSIAQCSGPSTCLDHEINNMQFLLRDLFCSCPDSGKISYGSFVKLPKECQELLVCTLYYFSNLESEFLQSLAYCCICSDIEPSIILRIVDVLQSAYKVGHVRITDYISFLITIVGRFEVLNGQVPVEGDMKVSNLTTFQAISKAVTFALLKLGDGSLTLRLLQHKIIDEMSLKPSRDNMHCLLRMVAVLDSKLSHFSEEDVAVLSKFLSCYLIDIASNLPSVRSKDDIPAFWGYYLKPCILLFHGTEELFTCTTKLLMSLILEGSSPFTVLTKVNAVALTLVGIIGDTAMRDQFSTKENIKSTMKNLSTVMSSAEPCSSIEERHKIKTVLNLLKLEAGKANILDAHELQLGEVS